MHFNTNRFNRTEWEFSLSYFVLVDTLADFIVTCFKKYQHISFDLFLSKAYQRKTYSVYIFVQLYISLFSFKSLPFSKRLYIHACCKYNSLPGQLFHQGISKLHRHSPLRVPIHTLVEWSLGDSFFLCPEKITLGQCRIWNHGPLDLQSNALPLGQRAPIYKSHWTSPH